MPNALLVSIDLDLCFYHDVGAARPSRTSPGRAAEPVAEFGNKLISSNEPLFAHLSETIERGNHQGAYTEVVLMIGSNRQDLKTDLMNYQAYGTTLSPALPLLAHKLQEKHPGVNVVIDTLLLADLFSGKKAGTSYGEIVNCNYDDRSLRSEEYSRSVFDKNKFSLLYAQAQRFRHIYGEAASAMVFYDDRSDILESLDGIFETYPHYLPSGLELSLFEHAGRDEPSLYSTRRGSGPVDPSHDWTVRYMALVAARPRSKDPEPISTKEDLQTRHKENQYPFDNGFSDTWTGQFDFPAFDGFRETILPQLKDDRSPALDRTHYSLTEFRELNKGSSQLEAYLTPVLGPASAAAASSSQTARPQSPASTRASVFGSSVDSKNPDEQSSLLGDKKPKMCCCSMQ